MLILAFDTAQGALSAAIRDGDGELASFFEPRTRGHAEALMPLLETLLAEAALGFSDLDALAVTVGPGTFTGLRVGLSAARGLALALGLPLVGVTTLESIAEPVGAAPDETVIASFDAKRNEVYLQVFSSALIPITEPLLVDLGDVAAHLPEGRLVLVGTGSALLVEILAGRAADLRIAEARPQPEAAAIARIAMKRLAAEGRGAFRQAPQPLYIRAPDAKLPGGRDPREAA